MGKPSASSVMCLASTSRESSWPGSRVLVIVTLRAPMDRCGLKKAVFVSRARCAEYCEADSWRMAAARTYRGSLSRRSYVQKTASSMSARLCSTS